jgi:aryl-alcohol dehydrogenase-like predicted oxidoreductase
VAARPDNHPSAELSALSDVAFQTADRVVTTTVQDVHKAIARRTFGAIGPAGAMARVAHDGIAAGVYGAMRITGAGIWGDPADPDAARALLHRVVELGVDFIDTAHAYGPETSERLIGEALDVRRDDLVVATKSGLQRPGPHRWEPDGRPETIRRECERSLQLLRTDRIDVFQLHRPDPKVPFEESVGGLAALREEGKIRHVGLSNVGVEQLDRAQAIVPIVSVQNRYNVADRHSEAVVDACEEQGIAFFPWWPLAVGGLAEPGGRLDGIARAHDATPGQVALAWLLARSPVVCAIPGTASLQHLEENMGAAKLELTPEELAALG